MLNSNNSNKMKILDTFENYKVYMFVWNKQNTDKIWPFICLKVKFNNIANGKTAFNVNSNLTHTTAVKSTSG